MPDPELLPPPPKKKQIVSEDGLLPPPPKKKMEDGTGDGGGIKLPFGGTVGASKVQSNLPKTPTEFKGRNVKGQQTINSKDISTWVKAKPEPIPEPKKEQPKSIFDPSNLPDEVTYTPDILDSQEFKEYEQRSNKVQATPQTELVKQIVKERNNPDIMRNRANEFINEDLQGDGKSALTAFDENGLDIPQYLNKRRNDIYAQVEKIDTDLEDLGVRWGENFNLNPEVKKKQGERNALLNKLDEINKYGDFVNRDYAIKTTDPTKFETKSDYLKALGNNIKKGQDYEGSVKKEQDIYTGAEKEKIPDVVQKENFDNELTAINALKDKVQDDYSKGVITEDEAKQSFADLDNENVALENKYPKVKIDNLRNRLGNYIAENRNKNGLLEKGWEKVVWAEPTEKEVEEGIRTIIANTNGTLKVSEDEIRQLIKEKEKIPLTGMVAHAYKSLILDPSQALDKWIINEHGDAKKHYERNLEFRDPTVYQQEQPQEIATETGITPETTAIRNAPNPNAGKKADFLSTATLNNIGDVAGIIGSYVAGNKIFSGMGMENIGANITTSAFLNYHHNKEAAKELTDDDTEQNLIASTKSIITGLIFAGINPSKLVGKVEAATEKEGMQKLLDAYRKGGIANTDPTKFKELVKDVAVQTAKDLGKNISLMDADKIASYAIDALVNKRSVENRDLGNELMSELPSQIASLGLFSMFHGRNKAKANKADKARAIELTEIAAKDLPAYEQGLKEQVESGKMSKEDADLNLKFVRDVSEKLMSKDLQTGRTENFTKEQKVAYALNMAKEQDLKDASKELTDKVQIDENNRQQKELVDERRAILNGKQEEYNHAVELFDRAYEKGTHNQTLDAGTKSEGVKYLSEQALTAPNSFKNQTGRDVELTTDLIALNQKHEIREEIKAWKEKIKPDGTQAEKEAIQKHIDLLESGLEKQKPKVEEVAQEPIKDFEAPEIKGEPENISKPKELTPEIIPEGGKPEEISQPIELSTEVKETKNEPTETKETVEVPVPETKSGITTPEIREATPDTTAGKESSKEPPKEPVEVLPEGEKKKGITHAAVAELRKLVELPEYEGKPVETHEQLIAEAQQKIKDNPNLANETLDKMEKGTGKITNKDNAVMAIYKATLDAAIEKAPTKELLQKAKKLAVILDVAGTEHGKLLESRKLIAQEDNLANFLLSKEASQGTALTEKQITDEAAKYSELKEAKEKLEVQLEQEREQHKKDIAELGLNKAKAKAKKEAKKSNEDYKAERKSIIEDARAALKKVRETGLQSSVPGYAEIKGLKAIAPHVKDFVKSLVNEGVDKLDNIITAVHAEFKDVLEGLSNRNVLDIIAGDFDAAPKEKTKNEKLNTIRLLKREAELIKELERERKGEEKAKTESDKTQANRRIDELKKKIAEVRRLSKEKIIEDEGVKESSDQSKVNQLSEEAIQNKIKEKIRKLENDIKTKKFLEEKKPDHVFKKSRQTQQLEDKVIDLENKIRHERSKDEYNKRGLGRKAFDKVMEVLGVRRLVQSALDMSVPFRQGATTLSPRKIDVWLKGFRANLQSVFNPKKFERIMHEIRKDPDYHDMNKDNIVFNDLGSADPNLHNEDFRKSFVYKIPLLSEPLKASNRSADAFLNVTRYEMYKKMRRVLEMKGLTRESDPLAFKHMGNFVMSMTGRGKMNRIFEGENMSNVLGNTFYGARLMASRFNLLNPVTYLDPKIPRQAKIEAFKDLAAFTGTMVAVGTALAYTTGAKISLNPEDSDFLQLRYGDKVYDISGGLATYVRTFLRMTNAIYSRATEPKYQGKEAIKKGVKSFVQFFRNKLSPNTAYVTDAIFGKSYGEDFDPSEIYRIYPMYTEDVIQSWKEEGGLTSLATVLLPNMVGIGYGSYASKGQIDKNLEDLLERNMRSDEMNSEKIINHKEKRPVTYKEFNQYADKRDSYIEKELTEFFEKGLPVVDDGKVTYKPYKDLTQEDVIKETTRIKSEATRKVKEEMFGKAEKTRQEKRDDRKLKKFRKNN